MKKRSKLKACIFRTISSPINVMATILSYIYIIHIRAMKLAEKRHVILESKEKGN